MRYPKRASSKAISYNNHRVKAQEREKAENALTKEGVQSKQEPGEVTRIHASPTGKSERWNYCLTD